MHETQPKPWYRQFWLWFVLAPLIAVVIASFATLFIAGRPPALVVDDYRQIPLAVERDRARDLRAAELGLSAELQFTAAADGNRGVLVSLQGDAPARLRLDLVHPTREEFDRSTVLDRAGAGYAGVVQRPANRVYVSLHDEADTWRLTGTLPAGADALRLAPSARP